MFIENVNFLSGSVTKKEQFKPKEIGPSGGGGSIPSTPLGTANAMFHMMIIT